MTIADVKRDENGGESLERQVDNNIKADGINFQCDLTKLESNEPVKKKRRVVTKDSDEGDIASKKTPPPSNSTKSPKSSNASLPGVSKKSTLKPVDEDLPSEEEGSAEDEPDPKTKMKAAQQLSIPSLEIY